MQLANAYAWGSSQTFSHSSWNSTPKSHQSAQANTTPQINFNDLIDRINKNSSIFRDIPNSIVRSLLHNVHKYPARTILMEEWQKGYPCFYIVLYGKVEISTKNEKIGEFSGFQILGEYGFAGGARTATVTVKETVYAIQVLRSNIERFFPELLGIFHRNLNLESGEKMRNINSSASFATDASEKSKSTVQAIRKQVEQVF